MRHLSFLLSCILLIACGGKQQADLIIHHATIYTVDSAFSKAEAIAIKDGRILATGTTADIQQQYEAKEQIDAQGKFIFPGFIDAHCHFLGYANGLKECDLVGTESWDDVLHRLADFSKGTDSTQWIIGRGWDQNDWTDKRFPTNERLNAMFPNRPVILTRVDGHAAIVNQKALDLAGIKAGQTLIGGEIITQNGKLTGVLVDNATSLVENKIPATSPADMLQYLKQAERNCFAVGLTGVQDCGLNHGDVDLIRKAYEDGQLNMRMYVMLSDNKENYEWLFSKGKIQTDQLTVNGFKLYADGALGSRGACLLHPYSDQPGHSGFLLRTKAYYDSIIPIIASKGFQACTHAIGDSANRTILNIYTKALQGKPDLRWRIEHAQVIDPADFHLFGASHIIPSVQPTHATSDMYWAGDRLGPDRIKTAYAYKQLLKENGWIPLGTDFPVEDINPFKTFLASTIRKDAKGFPANGFQTENALTREETIRGMTIWAAKAAFEEHLKGSLEKGKLADLIILDKDLMTCDEKDILQVKVLRTIVGGKTMQQKE